MGKMRINSGFTLIEVLTVSGIMALFSITLISILMASFRGGTKSQLLQRIRQDGDYVLTSMSREIRRTAEINNITDCVDVGGVTNLQLTLPDTTTIKYWQDGDKIASASGDGITDRSDLTGTAGKAENLSFNCYEGDTGNQIVTISFTLSGAVVSPQAHEELRQEFATSVSTREHE